jgi:hypothetical protein
VERSHALLADAIVLLHLAYVLFTVGGEAAVVVGGLLRWRWVRNLWFRVAHLLSVVVVAIEAVVGVLCPLTRWEYDLRRLAGQGLEEEIPFIARLVRRLIFFDFPQWVFMAVYILFASVVVASLLLVPPRRPSRK